MNGLVLCGLLGVAGVLAALLGLATGAELLTAYGAGAVALLWVGWPLLLLLGLNRRQQQR